MHKFERWTAVIMVLAAAAGTVWYIAVDWQVKGSLSAVGWSLIAFVWFVVLRRLFFLWRRDK